MSSEGLIIFPGTLTDIQAASAWCQRGMSGQILKKRKATETGNDYICMAGKTPRMTHRPVEKAVRRNELITTK